MIVSRLESMSPAGYLRLIRQNDGDICLQVGEDDGRGNVVKFAGVEFCTYSGGGGSPQTYRALIKLMAAMAADNLDCATSGRRDPDCDDEVMRQIIQWSKDTDQAAQEVEAFRVVPHMRMLLKAAKYLILAAKGPEGGPESWDETRDRFLEHLKELDDED